MLLALFSHLACGVVQLLLIQPGTGVRGVLPTQQQESPHFSSGVISKGVSGTYLGRLWEECRLCHSRPSAERRGATWGRPWHAHCHRRPWRCVVLCVFVVYFVSVFILLVQNDNVPKTFLSLVRQFQKIMSSRSLSEHEDKSLLLIFYLLSFIKLLYISIQKASIL